MHSAPPIGNSNQGESVILLHRQGMHQGLPALHRQLSQLLHELSAGRAGKARGQCQGISACSAGTSCGSRNAATKVTLLTPLPPSTVQQRAHLTVASPASHRCLTSECTLPLSLPEGAALL
jgi:hypothetical protein